MTDADLLTRTALVAARASYGRLLSWLAWRWRDIAAAEDALAEAFVSALKDWPRNGVPRSPEGWLMQAAKRRLSTAARRRRLDRDPTLTTLFRGDEAAPDGPAIGDHRLRLMFICAHPAIDPSMRCALMLQTVLGVDAATIGKAFLVSRETMTKRLVRAKAKIKQAGIRFEEPEADELAPRVEAVLEAIYGAYVVQNCREPDDSVESDLAQEALYLVELLAGFLPDNAEALGLHALLLFCEARKPGRLDEAGDFTPLDRQDPRRWDRSRIDRAGALLAAAEALKQPGPFQIEAAIQAAHCHRVHGGPIPWSDIARLYEVLLIAAPTLGARLGHVIAVSQAREDPEAGLKLLEAIDDQRIRSHPPFWAVRAHLLARAGRDALAVESYARALGLCADPVVRRHLAARAEALRANDDQRIREEIS